MPKTKTATLNLRIDPAVKEAVRTAAEREHRSVANMVEILIRRHSAAAGIRIPERIDPAAEKHDRGHPHSRTSRMASTKQDRGRPRSRSGRTAPETHDG